MTPAINFTPLGTARMLIAGLLMGLANLVPGVSGGTMILVMGLYDEFVSSVANITRLKFHKKEIVLLAIIGSTAAVSVGGGAQIIGTLVKEHRGAMWALFIGLTLGGAPLLLSMIKRWSPMIVTAAIIGFIGVGLMGVVKLDKPARSDAESTQLERNIPLDVTAGVMGVAAMVLPGISGAYMLLLIGRYEANLGAIAITKDYLVSGGQAGSLEGLNVLIPVSIGALIGLVAISNLLRWLLERHEQPTVAMLFGILLGSVIGLWPFGNPADGGVSFGVGGALIAVGFVVTWILARISSASDQTAVAPI